MSYIAFELDALNVARDVGDAAGIPEERVTHGLLRMWAWCFREKRDTVQAIQVKGFFGAEAAPALVAFGFLEAVGGDYRVRGAERYLRVSEARAAAGKARSSAAGRSAGRFTSKPPANHQQTTSTAPALTPSTEHRTPNTIEKTPPASRASAEKPEKVKSEKPTDPRHAPLVKVLVEGFGSLRGIDYPFKARDAAAVRDLLALAEPDTIAQAWARALRHRGFPTVSTLSELVTNFAHFVGTGPPPQGKPDFDPNQGIIRSGIQPDLYASREDPFPWERQ